MDYRETCRCGSKMEVTDLAEPDEVRHMANIWRKLHACVAPRVNRETGEIEPETIEEILSR